MILGTSSDVGTSFIATALCRLFANENWKVAPFKSHSLWYECVHLLNGPRIGQVQAIQVQAAKTKALTWMNPIIIFPNEEGVAEINVSNKKGMLTTGDDYYKESKKQIKESLQYLDKEYEVLVLEGHGSPVEIHKKNYDLHNMCVSQLADVPVILIADIDRGGVFASIIGTLELLTQAERKRVKGIVINKFRGDIRLFEDGVKWLEEKTKIPVLGVLPFLNQQLIDKEGSFPLFRKNSLIKKDVSYIDDSVFEQIASEFKKYIDWQKIKDIVHNWRKGL